MRKLYIAIAIIVITMVGRSLTLGSGSNSVDCPGRQVLFYCGTPDQPTTVQCTSVGGTPGNQKGNVADNGDPCSQATIPTACPKGGQQTNCEAGDSVEDGHSE